MNPKNVTVIYNDEGFDRYVLNGKEIDLDNDITDTVADVKAALEGSGYHVSLAPLRSGMKGALDEFIAGLKSAPKGVILNLCESAFSKSAYEMNMAALLELMGMRFTGSPAVTLGLSLDKGLTKDILRSRGIPTPGFAVFETVPSDTPDGLGFPLIVKPLKEDASVGIDSRAVVNNLDELKARLDFVFTNYRQPAIVEEYIDGREFNIAVMGNGIDIRPLPPSEIDFVDFPEDKPRICCYEAKWVTESPLYNKTVPVCPANVDDRVKEELSTIAKKAYAVMGCRDYARVDMRMNREGRIKVLEVNPNPDISKDAGFARAARVAGMEYPGLLVAIISSAWARYEAETQALRC